MCPVKQTGSQNESEPSDVKATASKKRYVLLSLVVEGPVLDALELLPAALAEAVAAAASQAGSAEESDT